MAGALEILTANGRCASTAGLATVSPVSGLTLSGKLVGPMRPSGKGTAVGGSGVLVNVAAAGSSTTTTGGGTRVAVGGRVGEEVGGIPAVAAAVGATAGDVSDWQLTNRKTDTNNKNYGDMKKL